MLFLISITAWSLLLTVFVGFSLIVALAVGSVLLLLIIGFLNSAITTFLWFEVTNEFWKLLAQGIVLFLVLFVLDSILITVPTLAFPGFATTTVSFVVGTFGNGLVAKRIAVYWKQENRAGVSDMNEVEGHSAETWGDGISEAGSNCSRWLAENNASIGQLTPVAPWLEEPTGSLWSSDLGNRQGPF